MWRRRLLAWVMISLLMPIGAAAQQAEGGRGIGYPSVAAALDALKARDDVRVSVQGGWTIVQDPKDQSLWSFTPPGHPAHPTAVKRKPVQRDGVVFMDMLVLCQAEKAACERLIAEFQDLNDKIRADILRGSQKSDSQWYPSEQQKTRAAETLTRFLQATDEGRYNDAYNMLTAGLKAMMPIDRFISYEQRFQEQSGGGPNRSDIRATWYKDPPDASAPGVYAAFNIRCSYRRINACEQIVILHEQSDGQFHVMRQERNFADKDSEQRLRDLKEKAQDRY